MRNCFVYKCDRQHKNAPKRTMFNVPKDPQKFEEWRQALPKHRPLAKHDRVCEKHFKSSDILRDWTYQIQGKTRKLLRTKPILQPDAIPSIFSAFEPDTAIVPNAKRRRKKSPEPSEEGNSVVVVVESTSQPLVEQPIDQEQSVVILINDESENASRQDATSGENKVAELFEIEMDIIEKESIFEELYDNIFEVELPSTLWGVHREPDRKFVAFSRFEWREQDVNAARSVSLLVDSSLGCRAWFGGKLVFSNDLTPKLVSRSDDKENPILSNMAIVELLDNLEQSATKEEWDAEEIKTKLETCVRS